MTIDEAKAAEIREMLIRLSESARNSSSKMERSFMVSACLLSIIDALGIEFENQASRLAVTFPAKTMQATNNTWLYDASRQAGQWSVTQELGPVQLAPNGDN